MAIDPRDIELTDPAMIPVLKAMTGAQRVLAASGMFRTARALTRARLAGLHPEWDAQKLDEQTSRSLLDAAIGST